MKALSYFGIFLMLLTLSSCAPKKVKFYDTQEALRGRVVDLSISLIGKPYSPGGKGPDRFDCSGLIHYVYRSVNIILPLTTERLINVGVEVTRESAMPADIVIFKIKKELHAGIMINRDEFVHASKSRGVAVDTLRSPYWEKNVLTFRSVIF